MSENKQDKPRICEVLGVEVGERFKVDPSESEYYIDECGEMHCCVWNAFDLKCGDVSCRAINHPERIIRKPRFTEDEITFMRYLYGCGVREIKKPKCSDCDISAYDEMVGNCRRTWWLPPCCLPSLRPGESAVLKEVVGGAD